MKAVILLKSYIAGPNDAGARLSRFVLGVTSGLPGAAMHRGFRKGRIKVNGHKALPEYRLAKGDVIELYLNDEFFPARSTAQSPPPGQALLNLGIVHRAGGLAILYKPAGVLSHRDARGQPGLLDAFTAQLIEAGAYNPAAENTFAPALCNRLDRGTEGLVIAAETAAALRGMNMIIRLGLLKKTYLCICSGHPPEGVFHARLARNLATHTVTVSPGPAPGSKAIATGIKVLEEHGSLSLCEVTLITGRTHQIRAHLAFLGAPLWGEHKYTARRPGAPAPPPTQALCAWRLAFAAQLPPESGLAQYAGHCFTADAAALPGLWARWKNT